MYHRVCMATDFFYPNVGGVEEHVFNLSQCLLKSNHRVVVITHSYGERVGIRYMTNGLKVYYLPVKTFYNQAVLPSAISSLPLIRYILIRERITIVHGHSAFSTLAHETMAIARLMGLRTVFTDHSLFGFADTSAIVINKFLEICLAACNHCICVSHIGKENTVLRARVHHECVSVIPNAVDTTKFTPKEKNVYEGVISVVVVSRLVYRKGIDLLAQILVELCDKNDRVRFIIGGDGPKRSLLEKVVEKHSLEERVQLLGSIPHIQVGGVLRRGNIFLNTSLTEAYCMAIVEAASCGLKVVSTRVGGIPEVLPPELIYLAEPDVASLMAKLDKAIDDFVRGRTLHPSQCHDTIRKLYTWQNIATRTETIYNTIAKHHQIKSLKEQYRQYLNAGVPAFLLVISLMHIILNFLDWFVPKSGIDLAKDLFINEEDKKKNE